VDVRAYPASRRHPHFARAALAQSLANAGVRYAWEGQALGGRRKPAATSPHLALANPHFRAYADHMKTTAFRAALERLVESARNERTAIMCAERLPSECHRALIADFLLMRGIAVTHIVTARTTQAHTLNDRARREGDGIVYDAGAQLELKMSDE
jgi:uncharacterized protein (DUF488 family)